MKRVGGAWLVLLLVWPLWAAGATPDASGLSRLKNDFSGIIRSLLSCYEKNGERRLPAKAVDFGEIRTHPIFELAWGKHRQHAAAEQTLLRESALLRQRLRNGACPPPGSEQGLCRVAQEYIQAADRDLVAARQATSDLPVSCGLGQVQRSLASGQV